MSEKRKIPEGYTEVQEHKHRGVEFFTAKYSCHFVLEPLREDMLPMLEEYSMLWYDSAHSWARGMPEDEQRARLIHYAKEEIDKVISGEELQEWLVDEVRYFIAKYGRYVARQDFFKKLKTEVIE